MKKQIFLTPLQGKKLIAAALAENAALLSAAREHTLVIVAGTTNGFIAKAVLKKLGFGDFDAGKFFRGVFSGKKMAGANPPKDVVIRKGELITDMSIDEIAPALGVGDLILKGGNALYLPAEQVGVVIGNPALGTMGHILSAVYGRRASLLMPIGLEKRVEFPIDELEAFCNAEDMAGPRLMFAPGVPYTELDALESVGVSALILAAGGVEGYEGGVLLGLEGDKKALDKADRLLESIK